MRPSVIGCGKCHRKITIQVNCCFSINRISFYAFDSGLGFHSLTQLLRLASHRIEILKCNEYCVYGCYAGICVCVQCTVATIPVNVACISVHPYYPDVILFESIFHFSLSSFIIYFSSIQLHRYPAHFDVSSFRGLSPSQLSIRYFIYQMNKVLGFDDIKITLNSTSPGRSHTKWHFQLNENSNCCTKYAHTNIQCEFIRGAHTTLELFQAFCFI